MQKKVINNLKIFAIKAFVVFANILYLPFKILPTQNKVTFISRLQDTGPLDFELIINSLKTKKSKQKTITLCKTLNYGLWSKISYAPHIIRQMYHIATSRVVVLDSYCIPICILRHKKTLTTIQLWHGLGSFKKFAYSILDKSESITKHVSMSSHELAKIMHMHENYDIIIASNPQSAVHFAEAFNYNPSVVKVISLPRVDYLCDKQKIAKLKKQILSHHKELKTKQNILYAPTFRRNTYDSRYIKNLIRSVDYSRYNLIIKLHKLTNPTQVTDSQALQIEDYSALQLLSITDYLITDYSAIIYEGYLLNVPAFFYQFDLDKYEKSRGFYTPLSKFPAKSYTDPAKIMSDIEKDHYSPQKIKSFIDSQITHKHGNADKLADIIINATKSLHPKN